MAILSKGTTYSGGDAVTAANLNTLVDSATFVTGSNQSTDDSTLEVHSSGYLKIKDGGVDTTQLEDGAVTSAKLDATAITTLMPSGGIIPYAGASAPTNWLFCAGQAVSRTTYATLFTAISTTYGVGDGSSTFNLPDLRGRVAAGKDDMGGSGANRLTSGSAAALDGDTLGTGGGVEEHTLVTAELPSHDHFIVKSGVVTETGSISTSNSVSEKGTQGGSTYQAYILRPGASRADVGQTSLTGSGSDHTNVQPTLVLNYIIKT